MKRTVKQPTGYAQSPLSSAFPIILLLGNFLCSTMEGTCLLGRVPKSGSLGRLPGFTVDFARLVLLELVFMSWQIIFIICAW